MIAVALATLPPLDVADSRSNLVVGRRINGEQGKRLIAYSRPIGEQAFRTDGKAIITGMHQNMRGEAEAL